jgi:hypothetical protein
VTGGALEDWQPIPIKGYARPRAAGPLDASLVPAYAECTSPNSTHGAPLSVGSCTSPSQTSGFLTLGTPDANGKGANGIASVRFGVAVGDPSTPADEAEVALTVKISDVRKKADLSDYAGELEMVSNLRITDKDNTPNPGGPGPGTVLDIPLEATVSCVPTASTTIGSACNLYTTIDALYPNAVKEGRRSIWQLPQVKVYDGGADGLASSEAGNTLFLDQGVFVP